jgi:hypothetical protein
MISRITPLILLVIAVGLFFAYTSPTYSGGVESLRKEIRGYDAALAAAKLYQDKEGRIREEQASIPENELARLKAFLPDGVDNVQLILDLDALANRTGITLRDFDVENPEAEETAGLSLTAEGPVESLDIGIVAVGDYASFKTFLAAAEKSLRPLDLVELGVEDSDTGVYTYTMTFRIYWMR